MKLISLWDGCYTYPVARPRKDDDCVYVKAFCGTRPRAWTMLLDIVAAKATGTAKVWDGGQERTIELCKDGKLTRAAKELLARLVPERERDLVYLMGGSFDD